MSRVEENDTHVEPCVFGGCVVVRKTPLDRLPWYWKLALVVTTLYVSVKFTIPFLDWIFYRFLWPA